MRALMFERAGVLDWREVPEPELPADGALVRPLAVARCDLDAAMAAFGLFPGPFGVGHECVAEVLEVAEGVTTVRPGQRVLVPFQVSCGACGPCAAGRFAACAPHRAKAGAAFGFGAAGGGHGGMVADRLAVPHADHLLLPAPDGVPDEALCLLADNVCDGYRTVAPHLAREPGADVLVVGGAAASIGLYAVATARALGAGRVRYVDADPGRCAVAEQLGAEVTRHAGDWPRRFDRARITVDNTGDEAGLACTLRSTDDYGWCTGVTIHFQPTTSVPLLEMYTRGVTFHVSRAESRGLLPEVAELVADGRLDPLAVPVTRCDWADAVDAWLIPATKLVLVRTS
jgi:alcohol dehydrogenase